MSKDKATPRPWSWDGFGSFIMAKEYGDNKSDKELFPVAEIRGWGHLQYLGEDRAIEIQDANAELIVKAVNGHDELLEALKGVVSGFENSGYSEFFKNTIDEINCVLKKYEVD